jgi:hypothetical protein
MFISSELFRKFDVGDEDLYMKPVLGYIYRLSFVILGSLALVSCEETGSGPDVINDPVETPYYDVEFSIDATYLSGFQIFKEETVHNNIGTVLTDAGKNHDDFEKVGIKEAQLNLVDGGSYPDFNMLKYVELTIYTDSLGEDVIAWLNPVPADRTSLTLNLSEEDVLPYFKVEDFILTAQGFLKQRVTEEIVLQARVKFRVE